MTRNPAEVSLSPASGNFGGKDSSAVRRPANFAAPLHEVERELGVEMGELLSSSRGFPLQQPVERLCVYSQQKQQAFAGEVFVASRANLVRRRKMDEPIAHIVRRAAKGSCPLRSLPLRLAQEFVNKSHRGS